jgi:PIN domain nuclease of toxin-antitoxin system
MNYLLDTHSIIWFSGDSPKLSEKAYNIIRNSNNTLYLSLASIWEMAIKLKIGKLYLEIPLIDYVEEIQKRSIILLPINLDHIVQTNELELIHNDPFDRLIIAQSIIEDIQLISRDSVFDKYGIQRVW